MKLKFKATGDAPVKYGFDGEKVTAFHSGESDTFDFSNLNYGDKFEGIKSNILKNLKYSQIVRHAARDKQGTLKLTLCQKSGELGSWKESNWINADVYDENVTYIKEVSTNG